MKKRVFAIILALLLLESMAMPSMADSEPDIFDDLNLFNDTPSKQTEELGILKKFNSGVDGETIPEGSYSEIIVNGANAVVSDEVYLDGRLYVAPGYTLTLNNSIIGEITDFDVEGSIIYGENISGCVEIRFSVYSPKMEALFEKIKSDNPGEFEITIDGNKIRCFNTNSISESEEDLTSKNVGSVMSDGNIWIILAVIAVAFGTAAVLIVKKQKENKAVAAETISEASGAQTAEDGENGETDAEDGD